MAGAIELRCHRCTGYLGETAIPLEIVGLFKESKLRGVIPPPRDTRQCKACRWTNVFMPLDSAKQSA